MKQWKRLAALSSAIVMAAATLTYFPNDTLQNIRLEISASAGTTTEPQVWNEDNLTWTLYADGKLTISGTGAMKDYNAAENLSPAYMNSDVKKVVIEDGVTSIGELAFYKCSSLTNITIPDSVTCIAYAAFHGCSSLSSITIPNSVTSIGIYAFVVCSSLTSITIPDGVTSIGWGAFSDCSSLKTISLSCKSSLKKSDFGEQADLVSYTNQHLLTKTAAKAATCTESGNKEYWTCKHCGKYFLSDDTNPATATAVELSETVIPALKHKNATTRGASEPTETEPGYSGDRYCPDCDTVFEKGYTYWNEDNLTWKLYEDGTLTISGTGAMKDYDYYNNPSPASQKKDSVKKVVIEDGVTSIRNSAFYDCNSLTSITIPNSVTSIGAYAFSNCYYLTNITIPNSVTSIENYAFRSCSSLTSITIPDSVTSIGELAFYSCDSLTSITISNSVTSIEERAFAYCSSLTSITIPDSVTSIEEAAFAGCSSLTSITIPDSVTSIGEYAFQSCSSLTSITIPDSVTSIGDYVFISCSSLTTISLSCKSSLKRSDFGKQADLVSYTSHTLNKTEAKAATCSEDGNKEYWTCEHCGKYFLSDDTNPETAKAVELSETILPAIQHKNAELRNASEPTETSPGYSGDLYCPDCDKVVEKGYTYWNEGNLTWKLYEDGTLNISGTGAMKNYDADDNPSPAYKNSNVKKIVIEKGVTNIGERAFYDCSSLTSVIIPDSVISIGTSAFNGCSSLTNITIPDSVTSIGNYAFEWCNKLSSITLSNNITSIGNFAFHRCPLTSITIPDSVTSIGAMAFHSCSNLKSITIPDSVTSIESSVFYNCTSLTSITIPDSVTSIGRYAFENCSSLKSITIPDSVTSIGYAVFKNCSSLQTISLSCKSSLKKSDFGDQANLVSYTSHTLKKTEAKAATCTEDGNKEYWTCEHCGKYFLSDDANPETAKAVELSETVIPASHKLTKVEAKAATCTEDGNIEYWTCEHCKKYFLSDDTNPETATAVEQSETIIPASHELTKVEAKAATCTEDGNIEYWQCDVCKKTFTDEAGKNAVDNVIIPALKHSYNENGFCENDDTHYQPANYNEEIEKYEISNAGQLYWFAEQVNSGDTSLNAVLTTDIVVNETVLAADGSLGADPDTLRMWRSIGDDDTENIFKGIFDGQGHTISGLYFSNDSNESDVMCASLFGFSAGIIQNVGLEDSYFNYYYAKIDGQLIVSGVAAGICAINNGQIVNCYNAGTILGYGASGICAINSDNGSIENCYNTGVIRGFGLVVGICNMNAGSMKDCYNNNSDITVMTDSTIIDENDEKSYASGICNINDSSGRIENCYHVGQVSGADVNNNICNINAGQIENSYYDCNICDKDAITQNESSAVVKNVESKTTKQFASGEVTYLLNGDQSVRAFYQNLAKEKYPTLNQKSKVVMQLEMIYDESFGEDATTNKTYHNAGDTIALETSPDKAYTYQYFVNGKQIEESNYTLTGNTKMTVKRVPVEIELSEIDTIQLTCQKKMTLDLTAYLKNFVDLKPVQFQLDADSKLPDGLKLTEDGILSGTPKKAATVKTTIVLTAENDSTKEMNLVFIVNAPVTTTTTTITTTKATTTTKPNKTTTTKVTTTTKPNKTTTTKATTTTTTTISSYGDVNLDGMVDILDAVFLNKYLATLIQFSDAQMANADCYQDGVLNDQDTTALMQFIILLIDDLPVQPTEK